MHRSDAVIRTIGQRENAGRTEEKELAGRELGCVLSPIGKWQATPPNFATFKRRPFSSLAIQFLTYYTPWFSILGEEMTVRDKNHQYQQKMTFWNLICKYVFLKSDEKVTRNMIFLCFCVFFQENMSSPYWENGFRKVHEIIQMPSFWTFQSDQFRNLSIFRICTVWLDQKLWCFYDF